jgi:hypothetical protein
MKILPAICCSLLAFTVAANVAAADRIYSDKRDLTAGSIAGAYYIVHRATQLCVEKQVHDAQWREELLAIWTQDQEPYLLGARGYMLRRQQELETDSGVEERKRVESELRQAFTTSLAAGEAALFKDRTPADACANIEVQVTSGTWDLQTLVTSKNAGGEVDLEDLRAAGQPYVEADAKNLEPMPFPVLP